MQKVSPRRCDKRIIREKARLYFGKPLSYRDCQENCQENGIGDAPRVSFLIAQSKIFHDFCKLGPAETVDYTQISRTEAAIESKTWEKMNQRLSTIGINAGIVDSSEARMNATVVAVEMNYPADVRQLCDCYDAIALRIRRILDFFKTKKLYLDVTRFSRSTSKQRRRVCRRWMKKLIRSASEAIARTQPLVAAAAARSRKKTGAGGKRLRSLATERSA